MKAVASIRMFHLSGILAALACATTGLGQVGNVKAKPDPRIKAILEDEDIKYSIDKDGDFRVIFDVDNGRSQLAFIRSQTSRYDDLEIREILSVAYRSENAQFPAEVSDALLEDSYDKKLGAWGKQGNVAVFVVRIAADADADTVRSALKATLYSADIMERKLSGDKDEF